MKVNKHFAKRNEEVNQLKIAFLIMAHNNVELLNDFIQQILRYDKADIFVHVDKKAENMIPQIKKAGRIHILKQHIDAAWGDYTQIEMIHLLLDEAYRFGEYDYYSLHSGVDMLIKPVNDLVEYLSKTRKYGYYDCSKLPAKNWGHGGGLERISLKYPQIFRKRYQPQHPIRYIDYVVEALRTKPTSNRIVLPTYNMDNVNQSLDDKNYLPSLVSIQFGKTGKTLIVHMHLRALEANRFLKINICEIEYLINQMKSRYVEFDKVKIIISAFRVQRKEKFNCFLKAKIDMMNETELTTRVNFKDFKLLCSLFEEKRDAKETITKVKGVKTVFEAMKTSNKVKVAQGDKPIYSDEIINMLGEALDIYDGLDKIHKASSIQSEKENELEEKLDELLDQIIKKLTELKEVDS